MREPAGCWPEIKPTEGQPPRQRRRERPPQYLLARRTLLHPLSWRHQIPMTRTSGRTGPVRACAGRSSLRRHGHSQIRLFICRNKVFLCLVFADRQLGLNLWALFALHLSEVEKSTLIVVPKKLKLWFGVTCEQGRKE